MQRRRATPNTLSWRPLFVKACYGSIPLGIATCFSWEHADKTYLVTNGHVVSGVHPDTGQSLESNGAVPDRIEVDLHMRAQIGTWATHAIELWDAQGRP